MASFYPADWALQYPYTADLLCLDFCRPHGVQNQAAFTAAPSPLRRPAWEVALRPHPDRAFVTFILTGIRDGFCIGFNHYAPLKSAPQNMRSELVHPEVVQQYLDKECSLGRMLGPFSAAEMSRLPACHINQFGVIPKGHNTGNWRLIIDLSFPPGGSVNDGISSELCSLTYTSVEQVAEVAARHGKGALMAKIDIESAYRLVPVHPHDRPLQAVQWKGDVYVDPMHPFRLRPAPKIFNTLADSLEWYLRHQGIEHVFHYLDDFIVVGAPGTASIGHANSWRSPLRSINGTAPPPALLTSASRLSQGMPATGVRVPDWAAQSRMQSGAVRQVLPQADDRSPVQRPRTPHAAAPYSAK